MSETEEEKKKQVIGLYGEMQVAMRLHANGWQGHRSGIDSTLSRHSYD